MLLYGCEEPGYYNESEPNAVWNCDPNPETLPESYPFRTTCAPHKKNQQLWQVTLGAPDQPLPKDAGFKIGGDTGLNFLVLRMHQENVPAFLQRHNESILTTAKAGFKLTISPRSPNVKRLSLAAVGVHGIISPHSVAHLESAFKFKEPGLDMHPISFQVHTHKLGTAVTAWKVSPDGVWSLIGRRNPQLEEMFVPVADPSIRIKTGDVLASRCTMNNTLDRPVLARYAIVRMSLSSQMLSFYLLLLPTVYPIQKRCAHSSCCTAWTTTRSGRGTSPIHQDLHVTTGPWTGMCHRFHTKSMFPPVSLNECTTQTDFSCLMHERQ